MADGALERALILMLIPIVCTVIFHAGKLSQRVDSLDKGFNAIPQAIADGFKEIARLIREGAE